MEKIDQILDSLYDRVIEPMEAKEQLLDLFAVSRRSELLSAFSWVSCICEQFFNSKLDTEDLVDAYQKSRQ